MAVDSSRSGTGDLRHGWPLLAGCVLAMSVGVISLPAPAVGLFMTSLQREFEWSRTGISIALSIGTGIVVFCSPLVGWFADRVREAWILAVGLVGMATAFLLFSRMGNSLPTFILGYALMMVVASGASTVPLARIISANFEANRGFALGFAMVGTGLASFLLPLLLTPYAAREGWRAGFVALALLILLCVPVILFLLRNAKQGIPPEASASTPATDGLSFGDAIRTRPFRLMAVAFPLITLAASGVHVHFLALLGDAGISPARAGAIASVSGVTLIVVRLFTGWLLDRAFAPYVAAAMMALAGLCMTLFALLGPPAAVLGSICYGLAIGAEIDIIAYLTARYFGMRAYGRIYGSLYATILVGATFSPVLYGLCFDLLQTYKPAVLSSAALLMLSAVVLLLLPPFPTFEKDGADGS